MSVVGRRFLPKDIELTPAESDLSAANGTKIPSLGMINMNFTVEGDSYSATLAVTNAIGDLILDFDWITQNDIQWDLREGKVFLGGRWIKLQQQGLD